MEETNVLINNIWNFTALRELPLSQRLGDKWGFKKLLEMLLNIPGIICLVRQLCGHVNKWNIVWTREFCVVFYFNNKNNIMQESCIYKSKSFVVNIKLWFLYDIKHCTKIMFTIELVWSEQNSYLKILENFIMQKVVVCITLRFEMHNIT